MSTTPLYVFSGARPVHAVTRLYVVETAVIRSELVFLTYFISLLLFYTMATVFQLYHGRDMMFEMGRRTPEPTHLLTHGIFNLTHHIGMV